MRFIKECIKSFKAFCKDKLFNKKYLKKNVFTKKFFMNKVLHIKFFKEKLFNIKYLKKHVFTKKFVREKVITKKNFITVGVFIIVIVPLTFSRYIYNYVRNSILESNGFYFYSSVLTQNGSSFNIDNWDGVNDYTINIDVTSVKNDELYTLTDISYDISVNCSNNARCSLSKESGTILSNIKTDSYVITVTPTRQIRSGEHVNVSTSVTSKEPYVKTLRGEYLLGVTNENFTYNITDTNMEKYFTLELTNNVSFYEVMTAFGSYRVGDTVPLDVYYTLSDADKAKCFSALVELQFDPHNVYLDLTNDIYKNNISYDTVTINGYQYINKIRFYMDANANKRIVFYKDNVNNDYSYPIVNSNSIVRVNVSTAG